MQERERELVDTSSLAHLLADEASLDAVIARLATTPAEQDLDRSSRNACAGARARAWEEVFAILHPRRRSDRPADEVSSRAGEAVAILLVAGDPAAKENFLRLWPELFQRVVRSVSPDMQPADLEACVNYVLVETLLRVPRFQGQALNGWLIRTARNLTTDYGRRFLRWHRRRAGRTRPAQRTVPLDHASNVAVEHDPSTAASARDQLAKLFATLPATGSAWERLAFKLRYGLERLLPLEPDELKALATRAKASAETVLAGLPDPGDGGRLPEVLATVLGVTTNGLNVTVHRMRQKLGFEIGGEE